MYGARCILIRMQRASLEQTILASVAATLTSDGIVE
jgi:hypothetical protein